MSLSCRADSRSWPNGFSITTRRHLSPVGLGQAVLGQLPADQLEGVRRDREVERVVAPRSPLLVELIDRFGEPLEGVVVVELALHEADALGELLPHRFIERGAGVGLDRLLDLRGEVLVLPVAAGKAHQREARRQQPAVGEVIHGRHELLAGEVPGDPEQDQRRRSGNTVQAAVPAGPGADCAPAGRVPAAVVGFWHGCVGALAFSGGCCLAGKGRDELLELLHTRGAVGQVQPEDRAAVLGQDLGIAGGLRRDQLAERERPVRDGQVRRGSGRDLQEDADRGSALVELAGGVQEARAPAEGDRAAADGGQLVPDAFEAGVGEPVEIGLDAEVAVRAEFAQQGADGLGRGGGAAEPSPPRTSMAPSVKFAGVGRAVRPAGRGRRSWRPRRRAGRTG